MYHFMYIVIPAQGPNNRYTHRRIFHIFGPTKTRGLAVCRRCVLSRTLSLKTFYARELATCTGVSNNSRPDGKTWRQGQGRKTGEPTRTQSQGENGKYAATARRMRVASGVLLLEVITRDLCAQDVQEVRRFHVVSFDKNKTSLEPFQGVVVGDTGLLAVLFKMTSKSKSPEPGIHMIPLLSPMLLSTAAPSAAAMSRHNPSDRASHSPAPPGGTPMLYSKVSWGSCTHTHLAGCTSRVLG